VQASQKWFKKRVLALSLDQLRWRPRSGCWSIGECLEHLNLTLAYYLPKIEQTVGESRRQPGIGGVLFPEPEKEYLTQLEPPVVFRANAPSALQPAEAVDPDRIVDQFTELRVRYGKSVQSVSGLGLPDILVAGSLHPPIKSLGGVIALLAAHDRRHFWQAERVRNASGFPQPRR
jgi:hypothetical protein